MKKSLLILALMSAIGSASALEVGVNGGYTYGGPDRATYGVSVGEKFGKVGVEATIDRSTKTNDDQNRFAVVGSYDVLSLGKATVAAKVGLAYLDNQRSKDGFAASIGAGVSYDVFKDVALTADYRYQEGFKHEGRFDGNTLTAGVKFKF